MYLSFSSQCSVNDVALIWYFLHGVDFKKPSNSLIFKFVPVSGHLEFRTSEHHKLLNIEINIDKFSSLIDTKI